MKVHELIKILQNFDRNNIVIVDGYEDGYSDVDEIKAMNIHLDVNKNGWSGNHEEAETEDESSVGAVLIPRE